MTRFPVDLTERDWAVLDCYLPLVVAMVLWVNNPSWLSAALYLAFWWMAVYFQWAKKLRALTDWGNR